jgi:hypothetical protein
MADLPPAARVPLLVLGFVCLVAGTAGGLARLAGGAPAPAQGIAWHGALMASAFFGTLIALERAVAIGRLWSYAAPAACGAGGIAILAGQAQAGFALLLAGSALFSIASGWIFLRHRVLHTGLLALGALCLLGANAWLAAQQELERAVPLWLAFFVLTIGGERLELSRLSPVPRAARIVFAGLALGVAASCALTLPAPAGILLVAVSAWLARYDLATRTVRSLGLTRYIAICLLSGYVWLAAGGLLLALGVARDAALHAILVGFVFSMVFGHAPVILPAVLRVAFPWHPALYVPLALLHASVLLRMFAPPAGGVGNAAAIALFIATAVALVAGSRRA